MNEDDVREIAQQVHDENSTSDQFAVSQTPFHTHNGLDSQRIPFIGLSDVPVSYHGQAGKVATVNASETGLEFDSGGGGGTGTVTSVTVTGANGIGVSGSPITTSGTIALSLGAITPSKITATVTVATIVVVSAQAFDGSLGNIFTRTLGGSETFTQSNFSVGQCFIVRVQQGSGSTFTVTWWGAINWITSGAAAPVQTTTSSGYTTYGFVCTASNNFDGYFMATQ